ncbi:MAG: DEAD/DEAH box helicase [Saprospiraceae bacterium]|nr:DEAD/DEAH box helicase [Saprospiraceae bacterium]
MEFINPSILQSYAHFKKHYQHAIEKHRVEAVLSELNMLVSPYILRRTKAEVLKDLPDLEEQVFFSILPEAQRKLIEAEKSKARNALLELEQGIVPNKIHVLNALMKLRQLANHPRLADKSSKVESGKYEDIINTMETLVLAGNKILVFSSFVSHLDLYKTFLNEKRIRYVCLTGDNSQDERSRAVQQFSEDKDVQVFLISLKAGGVGLNLTAANYVLILDPWWNPFAEKQAIARAHRMGQEQKVTVIRFIAADTIEEKILNLQKNKLSLATELIDEHIVPDLDEEMMEYLLRD